MDTNRLSIWYSSFYSSVHLFYNQFKITIWLLVFKINCLCWFILNSIYHINLLKIMWVLFLSIISCDYESRVVNNWIKAYPFESDDDKFVLLVQYEYPSIVPFPPCNSENLNFAEYVLFHLLYRIQYIYILWTSLLLFKDPSSSIPWNTDQMICSPISVKMVRCLQHSNILLWIIGRMMNKDSISTEKGRIIISP